MNSSVVFTLTGTDRVGIVEDVTRVLLELGGNVGPSRMARLGGEFAMLMLVDVPADPTAVEAAFAHLAEDGYRVSVTPATHGGGPAREGWAAYTVEVTGADHEGIVHEIAALLARAGITIESVETGTTEAPVTGTPLFHMRAEVLVPPHILEDMWLEDLDVAARRMGVDIEVTAGP